jgi:hypothetical protein
MGCCAQVIDGERRACLADVVEQPSVEVVEALLVARIDSRLGLLVELMKARERFVRELVLAFAEDADDHAAAWRHDRHAQGPSITTPGRSR